MSSTAAADEQGEVAVTIWCSRPECGRRARHPLGQVRRSSAGLVFDAALPGAVTYPPGVRDELLSELRDSVGGQRLPSWALGQGRSVALLEQPPVPATEVECPTCGRIELDPALLLHRAGAHRPGAPPVRLTVPEEQDAIG